MAVTIGTFTFPNLRAQPFAYDSTEVISGQTARSWVVSGLLEPSEWVSLNSVYSTWRDARILDEDTAKSKVVGTTINFSGTGAGQSWSNIACWFLDAPEGTQTGRYIGTTVSVVDANQKLAVLLKQAETDTEDLPNLGTFTINGAVLTLLKPIDTYQDTPTLELSASGYHVIRGPLSVVKVKDIEGTTDLAGWNAVRSWYEQTVVTIPTTNSYYPLSAPTATAANKVVNGVTIVQYTVTMQLGIVI